MKDLGSVYSRMERYLLVHSRLPDEETGMAFYTNLYGNDTCTPLTKRRRVLGTLKPIGNGEPLEMFVLEHGGRPDALALLRRYEDCSCHKEPQCGKARSTAALLRDGRLISCHTSRSVMRINAAVGEVPVNIIRPQCLYIPNYGMGRDPAYIENPNGNAEIREVNEMLKFLKLSRDRA